MSIATTNTINCGSPAADVVFTDVTRQGLKLLQCAPSPQGDLAGQLTFRVEHETTAKGLVRSLAQTKEPQYNDVTDEYDKLIQINTVVSHPDTVPNSAVARMVEMHAELLAVPAIASALSNRTL